MGIVKLIGLLSDDILQASPLQTCSVESDDRQVMSEIAKKLDKPANVLQPLCYKNKEISRGTSL